MYGDIKDVSRFRALGRRAWVYLNAERRENSKHTPRALEATYLGFEPNTSRDQRMVLLYPGTSTIVGYQPGKV